jgi:ABC-type sugar transport system ATPase subunit
MTLADQIALMENGRIVQCNDPRTLYDMPEDVFGGWFLGNPGMNFVRVHCKKKNGKYLLNSNLFSSPVAFHATDIKPEVTIGIRPEHIRLDATPFNNSVQANVKGKTITIGGQYLFVLEIADYELKAKVNSQSGRLVNGKNVWIELPLHHVVLFNQENKRVHADITPERIA